MFSDITTIILFFLSKKFICNPQKLHTHPITTISTALTHKYITLFHNNVAAANNTKLFFSYQLIYTKLSISLQSVPKKPLLQWSNWSNIKSTKCNRPNFADCAITRMALFIGTRQKRQFTLVTSVWQDLL